MLDPGEARWLREQALDARGVVRPPPHRHLAAVAAAARWSTTPRRGTPRCAGASAGARWARFGEKLRRRADLEHWAAFPPSFDALTDLIAEVGLGRATRRRRCACCRGTCTTRTSPSPTLAGRRRARRPGPPADLLARPQLHPARRSGSASASAGAGWAAGSAARFARHGRVPQPPVDWRTHGRALVRQPAHDADAARTFGPAAAGPGAGGRAGAGSDGWRTVWIRTGPVTTVPPLSSACEP